MTYSEREREFTFAKNRHDNEKQLESVESVRWVEKNYGEKDLWKR